ncbi:agmatine deiminase family protein [Kutzneria viridogrisea]|uniref:Agmatine deiminase n=1 Tax=Kutzneria viridogrisea TaxID=47990 RepID=A0ABR6BJA2_9PSEU|nr:agmatine deiminase [Kutzneria viridogrisea]
MTWTRPAEWEPHARTIMCWPARRRVWGLGLPGVRADLARLARVIARYEPVTMLAGPAQLGRAQRLCGPEVSVLPIPVDDLWARDTCPTFVTGPSGLSGVDFHFNGWGGKQVHREDALVAQRLLAADGLPRIPAPIVAEGGSLEVDGEGTLLATESSLVNDNRNPGRGRAEIEDALKLTLGVRKVIWVPGVRGLDITDCHIDALARFAGPGVVLLDRPADGARPDVWSRAAEQAAEVLRGSTDAAGRPLTVVDLPAADPGRRGKDFLPSYTNFALVNGAVIMPRFGDPAADDRAAGILRELHPGREVVAVEIDTLAEGGGGIHCATQHQPVG